MSFFGDRAEKIWLDLKKSQQSKIYPAGNLTLYLWDVDYTNRFYLNLWNYKANLHRRISDDPLKGREVVFPEYPELRSDLIRLCKNRYFLKLLQKGELTTEVYTFTPRELQLILRLCPQSWVKNLHLYAKSESYTDYAYQGDMVKNLYKFLDYDPSNPKEFPLLNEESVKKLALGLEGEVDYVRVFREFDKAFKKVNEKLKNDQYITPKDTILHYCPVKTH